MGRDMGPILEEIRQLRDRLQIAEEALDQTKHLSFGGPEPRMREIYDIANKALEQIQKE